MSADFVPSNAGFDSLNPEASEVSFPLVRGSTAISEDDLLIDIVRKIIRRRDLRLQALRRGLFADPAWDMLLDLFMARLLRQQICVSSLCISSRAPATTALRWIKDMERHGEIVRRTDPQDRRRVFVHISEEAYGVLRRVLLEAEIPLNHWRRGGS